ncbi:hypothetical protein GBA52_018437 [Prunus armeniaca]|nr:hypothetical protein GBA52_018437 [Prunus armeniaca]
MKSSASCNGNLPEGASAEVLGDASAGYIVNVVREKGEEAVRIPPSISAKLKTHQITGVRFMWENIIQSVRKVKAGDKGLGCILAHMMGLGKTFQVIAFLYTAMRSIDLGLKTALIVTPVNVLHNWRQEFMKWRPSELKPLRVFMLEDVSSFQNPIENGQHTNSTVDDVKIMNQRSHILYEQLKGFVQRMDMNVAKKDLPPKTVFVIAVKLSPLQRKLYKRFLDVHGFANDKVYNEKIRKRSFFAGYQALAQIWNHPGILQLRKDDKDYVRREDAIENFLADDSSSDENIDDSLVFGESFRLVPENALQDGPTPLILTRRYIMSKSLVDRGQYGQTKPVFAYRLMAHGTMEEKIYKRQVTKEGLAARVVDRQQVHRTISKEEMLHLFEFGDDENHELGQDKGCSDQNMTGEVEILPKHKVPLSQGSCSSDKLMEGLLGKHYPRWIANFHEHETLLQENEEEKLSKEEQDMAWEVYRRALEWEEVQRVPLNESAVDRKPAALNVASSAPEMSSLAESKAKDISVQRKCTNLSHLLTLRSQGTKIGCTTVCGECGREICWKDLHRDGRLAR